MSQCPSCGGDCGYLKNKGCQYGKKTLPDMLTPQEHQEIIRIVARWDYATEAAIEAYLLGKKLSGNVAQAYLKGFDEASSQHGCAECGANDGHALYCVRCAEKFVGGYKESLPVQASELLTQVSTDIPPQRKPLTSKQIREIEVDVALNQSFDYPTTAEQFVRAIEAAHGIKEKNT